MSELKVGDKIRILEDGHWFAAVSEGDILEVDRIEEGDFHVTDYWYFSLFEEGIGWEKVGEE